MRNFYIVLLLLMISCQSKEKTLTAQQIIDKTIVFSGSDKVENSEITFKFRDKEYAAIRENGHFELYRSYTKDSIFIDEVLTNTGYKRVIGAHAVQLSDSLQSIYSNAINSVHYFSVLPFGLNDKAVHKKLLPSSTINGKEYYKIEITFSENGGGEDFEDIFIYWIGKDDFLIDYLAYSYHTNGGGKRFRVLKEQCRKNGVRFVDYLNFAPLNSEIELLNLDKAFENNQLKKISEIILEDIHVTF
ncbi:deoxyribose-phosphate aldolase [Polaribacter litorisediminis]|uniref:DUF6503 family protein n=1 Tax=Polaribacter litorisediminis TaxID=1908341 RepID=UPI001CBE0627|nr:DUF6503 family protein [Polaribacter litorisediminis]UAM99399.1 deoxyribose-phosphate aldolase [Polaribacter litorisediminis]